MRTIEDLSKLRRRHAKLPPWDTLPMLRHLARLLIVVAIAIASASSAKADNQIAKEDVSFGQTDLNQTGGLITIEFPFYDDDGNHEGLPYTDDFFSYLSINGTKVFRFQSFKDSKKKQDKDSWYWIKTYTLDYSYLTAAYVHETYGLEFDYWAPIDALNTTWPCTANIKKNKGNITTAVYELLLSEKALREAANGGLKVELYIDAQVENGNTYHWSTKATYTYTPPSKPNITHDFSDTPGKYLLEFQAKAGNTYSIISPESLKQSEASIDGSKVELLIPSMTDASYKLGVVYNNLIKTYSRNSMYTHNLFYKDTCYVDINEYPQPKNFKAALNNETGKVDLTWNMATAKQNTNYKGDLQIQRSTDSGFNNNLKAYTVSYDYSKRNYTFSNDISDVKYKGTYYYRIRRSPSAPKWAWDDASTYKSTLEVDVDHRYIKSAFAKMVGDSAVNITWEYDNGNVWGDNAEVLITRFNQGKGTNYTITVPADSVAKRSYTEKLTTTCDVYSYDIAVNPNNNAFGKQTPVEVTSDGNLFRSESGRVLTFVASKGYFSDHVELEWTSDGNPIDVFSIRAREYGSGNDYKQIEQVSANLASREYSFSHTKSIPGVVYEYQIATVTKCGDQNVTHVYDKPEIGFRTTTGDIYGRVTFESGQAVPNVEVRAEFTEGSGISGKAYRFDGSSKMTVENKGLMNNATDQATIEAWVKPEGDGMIVNKPGMYSLEYKNDKFAFTVGSQTVTTTDNMSKFTESASFVHVSAVAASDFLYLYVNDTIQAKVARTGVVTADSVAIELGDKFKGVIDEVRLWSVARDSVDVARDYSRYIVGNETGLEAYYTFDYSVDDQFFDISFKGNVYNKNHGTVTGAKLSDADVPTAAQLGFRSYTDEDGSYLLRALPFVGNGTTYMVVPRLGIHQFDPQKELRLISLQSQSHTVNFIDKSSFQVHGNVSYKGGTYPVEGVMFKVDGVIVSDGKGNVIKTGSDGNYTISVPVGIHEVKAVLDNHVFEDDGRITDLDGNDCNYQDDRNGADIIDITTIRYIGRVAGGTTQENYALGHSLSKNNLADNIKVTLTNKQPYELSSKLRTATYEHHKNPYVNSVKTNKVEYDKQTITITPNPETGEFFADVLPIAYNVVVNVPGYDPTCISGNNESIDFSNSFAERFSVNEYTDSISEPGKYIECADSVRYNQMSKFIARVQPSILVNQIENGLAIDYFGKEFTTVHAINGDEYKIPLYDKTTGKYALGIPTFEQGQSVTFGITTAEVYNYKGSNGLDKEGVKADIVPTPEATISFSGDLAYNDPNDPIENVETDENGYTEWSFRVGDPRNPNGIYFLSMTMTYGDSESPTSIVWDEDFKVAIVGSTKNGDDFITQGPDQVMFVLRDPPGSNSYSYLEKGITISKTSTYNGELIIDATDFGTQKLGTKVITYNGIGTAVGSENEVKSTSGMGGNLTTMIGGTDTNYSEFTTTTNFYTSSDPLYVGSNGDVYVGYSTNVGISNTKNISVIPKTIYEGNESAFTAIMDTETTQSEYMLVESKGTAMSQTFKTLFTYPQVYIENTIIPNIEDLRNGMLHPLNEMTEKEFQQLADSTNESVYVSYLSPDDPNFGCSNTDPVFGEKPKNAFDGKSYKIYMPTDAKFVTDTILALNQSIERWVAQFERNEEQKVNAELMENVSFHAGAGYGYSEGFNFVRSETQRFSISVGGKFMTNYGLEINGFGWEFVVEVSETTSHGGEFTTEEGAYHVQGFELSESGDDDYLSVDVCRENGYRRGDQFVKYSEMNNQSTQFPTFIFRTKGGATSCPYEGEEYTRFYQPGAHKLNASTVQIERPKISVEKNFIENVPSGKSAYFTMYLINNSDSQEDGWYDLRLDAESNKDGAQVFVDGAPVGATGGLAFMIPGGSTLSKTVEVRKGKVLNYDGLKFSLQSQCQCDPTDPLDDIMDTVRVSVHFIPSATDVAVKRPTENWTYNTKLPTAEVNGLDKHYMDVKIDGFDVNYDSFHRIMLQYKPASDSDEDWITLMSYYNDSTAYYAALDKSMNAEMINSKDGGVINYRFFMDHLPDQRYDIRAVGTSMINNIEYYNYSEVHSGIKDMYNPRLFGSAQPANGVLTVNDEIRLNFNETIAEGLLTDKNFEVTGVRNGAQSDHSVSVSFDGENDVLATEFVRNWHGKPLTVEMWILADKPQDAVLFSQGTANSAIELGITADNRLRVKVGGKETVSNNTFDYEQGTWANVALVYDGTNKVSAYYNWVELISEVETDGYAGEGSYVFGSSINGTKHYAGKMHNARIWDKELSRSRLQTNSLTILSGAESNLIAYYPMNEARGEMIADKAHGANLEMKGGTWVVPEGRAATFNGSNYLKLSTKACQVDLTMDYTIELWFRAKEGSKNAGLFSNGRGDGSEYMHSQDCIELGFDEDGKLYFCNNGTTATCTGVFNDNNWHHAAVAVNRTSGRAQIYIDGKLNTYFDANDLGGIKGDYLLLGARMRYSDELETSETIDNHFEGEIDEFRMWNLYRSEAIESETNSQKLDGTEMGLLAYYPFEAYEERQGASYVIYNYSDAKVQRDASTVIPDAEVMGGGSIETSLSAPVRGKDPVSKLLYDFVVNNDALIINLKEPYDRVEKTIVTFTVSGVRDLNGNEIVSPITWSAYVDRNQLKWSDSSMSIVKKVNEEKEFTVRATNNGGSIEHFTIENMPSWLDVTPTSGTINPLSSTDVKFTVDPSLNIGTYDEVVYLRNDNNVVESLQLTVKVEGEKPSWSVNPADYQYNMSIFGKLLIDNIYSSDENDILAAFNGSECVGVCTNKYYKINDMWYAMLTVYSNEAEASKDLEFRIWDASTGSTYIAEPTSPIHFVNNSVIGTPSNPVVFTAKDMRVQQIDLAEGWSWISVNVDTPNLDDINALLANNAWTSNDQLKSETDGFVSYSSNGWVGSLQSINNKSMYMIRSSKAQTLDVTGSAVDTKTCKLPIQGMKADGTPRWNYISYLPVDNMTLKEALAGYQAEEGDIVKSQTSMAMYDKNVGWIGSLEYMETGKGYMLQRQATTDVELQYPSKSAIGRQTLSMARTRAHNEASRTEVADYGRRYATNMTAVVRIEGIEALEGDQLVAYVNGECRGVATATTAVDGEPLFLMTISGEGAENVDVALVRGDNNVATAKSVVTYGANATMGTLKSPMVIRFVDEGENVIVYPTPFRNHLSIRAMAEASSRIDVYVTDVAGMRVAQWLDCNYNGMVEIVWNVDDSVVADGVYIVNVVINGKTNAIKTVKR